MKHNLKKNEKKKKVVFINGWRKMCSMVLIFSMAVSLGAGYVSSQRVEAKAYDTSMSQFNKQYLDTNTFTAVSYTHLVGNLDGIISRRINIQHRLVYQVYEDEFTEDDIKYQGTIKIIRMWTHYDNVR